MTRKASGDSKARTRAVPDSATIGRSYSKVAVEGAPASPIHKLGAPGVGDPHHLLRPAALKTWAISVLQRSGIDTKVEVEHPLQNEGAALRERVACVRGMRHDAVESLAARIYELAREVELAKKDTDPGAREFYASRAARVGYELGRLTMLAHAYGVDDDANSGFRARGAESRQRYSDTDRVAWRELRATKFATMSARSAAAAIVRYLKLPSEAAETVRKELGKESG